MSKSDEYLKILKKASDEAGVWWWPKYIYHYTDINNAVSILQDGKIYSRHKVNQKMINENAALEILHQTDEKVLDYVRFYFRPKTPTQYRNEGFIPKNCRQYEEANVPVPIFFAFEAKDMLSMEGVEYSEIALANKGSKLMNDVREFSKFDFKKIYSDGGYQGEKLTPYRRAEIVVPNDCDLRFLKHIWCRTNAEYISLCTMLKERNIYEKYKDKIGVKENDTGLFFKKSLYISSVRLFIDKAKIIYRNSDLVDNSNINIKYVLQMGDRRVESKIVHNLQMIVHFNKKDIQDLIKENNGEFIFQIYFDESLVYINKYSDRESYLNDLPY